MFLVRVGTPRTSFEAFREKIFGMRSLSLDFSCGLCSSVAVRGLSLIIAMLRIFSAASGGEVAVLEGSELELMEHGSTVGSLKRYLARKCFQGKRSRFQLRILRGGDPTELQDDEKIIAPMDLQLMLMNHLPPDEERDESFLKSCLSGDLEEVERRLHALQNPNLDPVDPDRPDCTSPLSQSADAGHSNLVRLLLEAGADVEWRGGDEEDEETYEWTALHHAASGGHLEAVRVLLEFGADIDATNADVDSPLHLAVMSRHADVVRLLLESGAEKELINLEGCRPLHLAADCGDPEIVRLLRDSGAELEAMQEDVGLRPLHNAAACGSQSVVSLLLDSGADKEAMTVNGLRPLHLAAKNGHREVVRFLLDSGAQREATDTLGRTPLKLAAIECQPAVEELLCTKSRRIISGAEKACRT